MSLISNNLKYLRRINGLTQENFALRIGTKRANVGAYEEARAVPPVDLLKTIANTFGITVDDFVKKDIRKLRETPDLTFNFDPKSINFTSKEPKKDSNIFKPETDSAPTIGDLMKNLFPKEESPDDYHTIFNKPNLHTPKYTPKEVEIEDFQPNKPLNFNQNINPKSFGNILLVRKSQLNDYLIKFSERNFLATLHSFSLPFLPENFNYRAFEIGSDFSFEGALLIGSEIKNLYELIDGKNYVLVSKTHGIIYRKVYNRTKDKGTFLLSPDNYQMPSFEISVKDVIEAWEVKAFLSQTLPEPTKSLENLQKIIEEMKFELERLKK